MASEHSVANFALFIDVENLIAGAVSQGLPVELSPTIKNLREKGRILVRRSFGDIKKVVGAMGRPGLEDHLRRMLLKNLVEIQDVPFVTAEKNTADMALVVDALSLAFTNQQITHFAIISSDRDYIPLLNKLHELNKTVITIVVDRVNVNPMVLEASDLVLYYDMITVPQVASSETPQPVPAPPTEKKAPAKPKVEVAASQGPAAEDITMEEGLRKMYYGALAQAIQALERQQRKALGAALFPMIQQLRSDFDPTIIGHKNFKEFIVRAEQDGVVKVHWGDQKADFTLTVPESAKPQPVASVVPVASTMAQDVKRLAQSYRNFFNEKLKVEMPMPEVRRRVLEAAHETFGTMYQSGPFTLDEWKLDVYAKLRMNGHEVDQRVIFKILLSLHYSRCFYCEFGTSKANPVITGRKVPESEWEQRVIANFCRQLKLESAFGSPSPEALAEVFYPGVPDGVVLIGAALATIGE